MHSAMNGSYVFPAVIWIHKIGTLPGRIFHNATQCIYCLNSTAGPIIVIISTNFDPWFQHIQNQRVPCWISPLQNWQQFCLEIRFYHPWFLPFCLLESLYSHWVPVCYLLLFINVCSFQTDLAGIIFAVHAVSRCSDVKSLVWAMLHPIGDYELLQYQIWDFFSPLHCWGFC